MRASPYLPCSLEGHSNPGRILQAVVATVPTLVTPELSLSVVCLFQSHGSLHDRQHLPGHLAAAPLHRFVSGASGPQCRPRSSSSSSVPVPVPEGHRLVPAPFRNQRLVSLAGCARISITPCLIPQGHCGSIGPCAPGAETSPQGWRQSETAWSNSGEIMEKKGSEGDSDGLRGHDVVWDRAGK